MNNENFLETNGFVLIKKFLNTENIKKLNLEIDQLSENILFNGYSRGVVFNSKVKYPHKSIYLPIANIKSINLMEISIDIFRYIFNNKKNDYVLTNLEIFIERNNKKELILHTDHRKGMIRAQIYILGGKKNSGGFKYIKGSNLNEEVVEHDLNEEEIEKFKDKIVDLSGDEGDLVVFDPWGYHGKNICTNERRSIMFEFQKKNHDYEKSSLTFNNVNLTQKVIDNIELFVPDSSTTGFNNKHGVDFYKNNYEVNFKILISSFVNLMIITTKKNYQKLSLRIKNKIKKIYFL